MEEYNRMIGKFLIKKDLAVILEKERGGWSWHA
jgi:hypothetical protein